MKLNFRTLTILLAALVALAIALAGCGGGGGDNGSVVVVTDPGEVARLHYSAWANHDVNTAMSYVSPEYSESGRDYNDLWSMVNQSPRWTMSNYRTTRIDYPVPDRASVYSSLVMTIGSDSETIEGWSFFTRRNGQWKICGYDGRDSNKVPSLLDGLLKALK